MRFWGGSLKRGEARDQQPPFEQQQAERLLIGLRACSVELRSIAAFDLGQNSATQAQLML